MALHPGASRTADWSLLQVGQDSPLLRKEAQEAGSASCPV